MSKPDKKTLDEILRNVNIGDMEQGDVSMGSKIGDVGLAKLKQEIVEVIEEEFGRVNKDTKVCPECNGVGVIWNPVWQEFYKKYPPTNASWDTAEGQKKALIEFFGKADKLPPEEPDCDFCAGQGNVPITIQDIIEELKK